MGSAFRLIMVVHTTTLFAMLETSRRNSPTFRRAKTALGPIIVGYLWQRTWSWTLYDFIFSTVDLKTVWHNTPLRSKTMFSHLGLGLGSTGGTSFNTISLPPKKNLPDQTKTTENWCYLIKCRSWTSRQL